MTDPELLADFAIWLATTHEKHFYSCGQQFDPVLLGFDRGQLIYAAKQFVANRDKS